MSVSSIQRANSLVIPASQVVTANVLIIGAGGGGGTVDTRGAGGGGGGGYIDSTELFQTELAYFVTVGGGGAGATSGGGAGLAGRNGNDSRINKTVGVGGAGGFNVDQMLWGKGGSTGGGGYAPVGNVVADVVLGQGSKGGNGFSVGSTNAAGGGGGGAGGLGGNATSGVGGIGGVGVASTITGTSVGRAGGGGGGTAAAGGGTATSGGGLGANTGANGTINTGGGGGGRGSASAAGNGGSGIIIIKIPNNLTATFSAGVTSSLSTSVPGFNIYSVTATSTISETVTFS